MSRVTYLLGAGASYGERRKDEHGQITGFTRGLPVRMSLRKRCICCRREKNEEGCNLSMREQRNEV